MENDQPVWLEPGSQFARKVSEGGTHEYRVSLGAGQCVQVVAEQRGVDVALRLVDPEGNVLIEVDSPNGPQGPESVSFVADEAQDLRIQVKAENPEAEPGEYAMRIERRASVPADRTRVQAEQAFAEGERLRRVERWEEAIGRYEKAADLWRAIGDKAGEALALYRMGWMHHELDRLDRAVELYDLVLPFYQKAGDRAEECALLNRRGRALLFLGRYDEALAAHERVAGIARGSGALDIEAAALNNIGRAHLWSGRTQKAIDAYDEALEAWQRLRNPKEQAIVLLNLGDLYRDRGKGPEARQAYESALALAEQVEDRRVMARILSGLGELEHREGRLTQARQHLEQALDLKRKLQDTRGEANTLNSLGTAHLKAGELERARDCYRQALDLSRTIGDDAERAVSLSNLGRYEYERGRPSEALRLHREALATFEKLGDRPGMAFTRFGIAQALARQDDLEAAREELEPGLRFAESLRSESQSLELRSSYFATKQHYWDLYIDVLMRLDERLPGKGYAAQAFAAGERRRFRGLLDALAGSRAEIKRGVDPELARQEREVQQRLDRLERIRLEAAAGAGGEERIRDLERETRELLARRDRVRARLRDSSQRHAALTEPRILSLQEVQEKVLDPQTVLLAYSLGEERSFLWVVTPDSFASHVLPGRRLIETLASRFHDLVKRAGASAAPVRQAAGAELADLVLAPAAPQLRRFQRLLLVADGALQQVPFAALPIPGTDGAPVVTRHEVVYLPSASVLASLLQAPRRDLSSTPPLLAVIADPVFRADDPRVEGKRPAGEPAVARSLTHTLRDLGLSGLSRLPYTRREAEAIKRLAPRRAKTRVALDFEASRDLIAELKDYRILHFATHSLIDNRQPELSGLALSLVDADGKPRDDGFLRLHEIYDLDLSAEMVVLSACETGSGEEVRGEGLVSLTRAFMYAGVPKLVVSLWKVDDRSTSELMVRFYTQLFEEGETASRALREAQRSMYCDPQWTEPHHWAGFVYQGVFGEKDGGIEARDTGGSGSEPKPGSDLPVPPPLPEGCEGS